MRDSEVRHLRKETIIMPSESDFFTILKDKLHDYTPDLIRMRRNFHQFPEPGWCEVRTSSVIADYLTNLGYHVLTGSDVCLDSSRMGLPSKELLDAYYIRALEHGAVPEYAQKARHGFTGVIGILHCGDGPVIGLRFDIDALPIAEKDCISHFPCSEGFSSQNPGFMHACGHDGHAAIGLTVARILSEMKSFFSGTVKLIFQPAEEGVRGARSIAEKGHLNDVHYLLGSHIFPCSSKGEQLGVSVGPTLATTKLNAAFSGLSSHAALPEKGHNAMLSMASAILNLHAIPRHSGGPSQINVGTAHAGSGRNVICDHAELELEVRGGSTEINTYMENYARTILKASADLHSCTCDIQTIGSAPSVINSPDMISLLQDTAKDLHLIMRDPDPSASFSEDFSYLSEAVQSHGGKSLFFYTLTHTSAPGHNPDFDFDESALPTAVQIFCTLVYKLMLNYFH